MFPQNTGPSSSESCSPRIPWPWKRRNYAPLKCWKPSTKWHDSTSSTCFTISSISAPSEARTKLTERLAIINYLHIYPSIHPSKHPPTHLATYLPTYPHIHPTNSMVYRPSWEGIKQIQIQISGVTDFKYIKLHKREKRGSIRLNRITNKITNFKSEL